MRLLGLDESEIASACRELAADAHSALDVGANDGWYALYFSSLPNISRIFAFEPDAATVEAMRRNFQLNDPALLAKATLVQAFVANRVGENGWVKVDDYISQLAA